MPTKIKIYCGSCDNVMNEYDEPIDHISFEIDDDRFEDMEQRICLRCKGHKTGFRFIGLTGYHVTKSGSVWKHYKNKSILMKPEIDDRGYLSIKITIEGKRRRFRIHRLVTDIYYGFLPPGEVRRHLNDKKTDPRIENLMFGTKKQNAEDYKRNKLRK